MCIRDSPKLIDKLLASPRYGERWARHWLDVVRYADSNGFETNHERKTAYPVSYTHLTLPTTPYV